MTTEPRQRQTLFRTLGVLLLFVGLLGLVALLKPGEVAATPPAPESSPGSTLSAPSDAGVTAPAPPPTVEATTATIVFATTPPATATVVWGRKLLGKITPAKPLVVVRPRDSGPLDVMVRAEGFLAVQTRAHTFTDNRVVVKLTPPENKSELFGYRAPLDAGVGPEQAAAVDALAPAADPIPAPGTTFRMVPVTPVPTPWLVPP